MLKKLLLLSALFLASVCLAGADVNQASEAELDGIKGIGPSLSHKILQARDKGRFKDWSDLQQRVKGIGAKRAAQLSEAGLRVNGVAYPPPTAITPSR
jgi:competence protein ComEA